MKKQQGFSIFGLIFLIAVIGAVVSVAIKIVPHYLDFVTIADATRQTLEQPRTGLMRQEKIMEMISKQLSINNIRLSELGDNAIRVRREDGNLIADIAYTIIEPVYSNDEFTLELTMNFERSVESRASDE